MNWAARELQHLSVVLIGLMVLLSACSDGPLNPLGDLPPRTFRMGFSAIPPRNDQDDLLAALNMWTARADMAIMHISVPYKAILAGTSATVYVTSQDLPLANYFKSKNLPIVVTIDVTNGLNRSTESPDLVELGRSIAEPAIQQIYRDYVRAIVTLIRPDYLGLAAETNLIREAAPAPVYAALRQMTNASAAEVQALTGKRPLLYVSVQADLAWGAGQHGGVYQGVETDFAHFPFMQALGMSVFPYFVFPEPEQVPLDYFFRLANGRTIPILVVESGWTSGSVGTVQSSFEKQVRYLRRQEKLLDSAKAVAVFQLTFTDLDITSFPPQPPGSSLPLFAQLGLVNVDLVPKPALATYDSIFARLCCAR